MEILHIAIRVVQSTQIGHGKRDGGHCGDDAGSRDGGQRLLVVNLLHTKYVWIRRSHGDTATITTTNSASRS